MPLDYFGKHRETHTIGGGTSSKGRKQIGLSRMARVNYPRLSHIINCWYPPKPDEAQRISEILEASAKELFPVVDEGEERFGYRQ